tara:strand:+ start:109 stop:687 length:579 start_codon:yes stop_codon:yes gene_type:complete
MLSLDITKKIKKPITRSSVQNNLNSENDKKQVTGFIVYVILILMFIPYMLYLYYPTILTFYIPNVDMIANILTTINKPDIFSKLYVSEPNNILSYISLNLINWISLMGIAYAISHVSYTRGIHYGMVAGGVMFLMTYLLPTQLLPFLIKYMDKHRSKNMDLKKHEYIILYILGFLMAISIIMLESYILESIN